MPKHNYLRFFAASPAILGLSVLVAGCGSKDAAQAPPAAFATPVTAVPAISQDVPVYLDEIGKAVASQSVIVDPQVSGIITARHFEDGADLKKDQLLFEIDPRPFQAQLDQAKGQLAKDQAQKTTADWNVKQDQSALEAKAISEQQLHNDVGVRDQAIGSIAVDEAAIETATLNLDYCRITSPIDGRAGQRLVDVGNVIVAAGQAPGTNLLSIQTLDPIYADFTITEAELLKVQQYMAQGKLGVQVQLPQDAIAAAGPQPATQPTTLPPGADSNGDKDHAAVIGIPSPAQTGSEATPPVTQPASLPIPRMGQLTFMDNAVQDGSGTVKLRATIPNSDHHFWPGQFVNVRLVLKVQKNAVLVPTQSVQISQKGPFVFIVKPDGTADPRPVIQGQRQGDLVVIEQGIASGEQVVVTGQQLVMPGGKVMVINQMHAPAGGAAGGPPAASADSKQNNGLSAAAHAAKADGSQS